MQQSNQLHMCQPPVIRHIACERLPARQYGGGDRGDPATACNLTTGNVDSTSVAAHKAPMPFRKSAGMSVTYTVTLMAVS
eukprot:9835802-Alexandrium_andersonii.AAC.1